MGYNGGLIARGTRVGKFVVEEELGAGGMAVVYAARDPELGRRVALKVLRPTSADDEAHRMRLLREGQAMAMLNHPNVITVHEVGIEGGRVFLAQELVDGGTLGTWLKAPHAQAEILAKLVAAGHGLAAAHAAGLVHRDFKPDNVLLWLDGRVRVSDFGLARPLVLEEPATKDEGPIDQLGLTADLARSPMGSLTRTGAVLGTPMYMAPEQHLGEPTDERSDQFSFCVTLYRALYGTPPFVGKTQIALADAVLHGTLEPEPKGSRVSPRLRKIILRGLSRKPGDRYPSMTALLSDLARDPATARRRSLIVLGLGGVIAAGLGVGYSMRSSPSSPAPLVSAPRTGKHTVAVLGFKNLAADPSNAWVSAAFGELLSAELSAGDALHVIPAESSERARVDLALPDSESLSAQTLERIRGRLDVDTVIVGSYLPRDGALTLVLSLEDVADGSVRRFQLSGTTADLPRIATDAGPLLRTALGVAADAGAPPRVRGALPKDPTAMRAYVEGLSALRTFEYTTATERLQVAADREPEFALARAALATAHEQRFELDAAIAEDVKAVAASKNLPIEQQMLISAQAHRRAGELDQAREGLRRLVALHPDDLEYGLLLAGIGLQDQSLRGRGHLVGDAKGALAALRKLPLPSGADPRIDVLEADLAINSNDQPTTLAAAQRAAKKARASGAQLVLAAARAFEGEVHAAHGDVRNATAAFDEARKIYERAGDDLRMVRVLASLAAIRLESGDADGAFNDFDATSALRVQVGKPSWATWSLSAAGFALTLAGRLDEAEAKLRQSMAVVASTDVVPLGQAEIFFGFLAHARGDLSASYAHMTRVRGPELAGGIPDALLEQGIGETLVDQGEGTKGREHFTAGLADAAKQGSAQRTGTLQLVIAALDLDEGHPGRALAAAVSVEPGFAQRGAENDDANAWTVIARAELAMGNVDGARAALAHSEGKPLNVLRIRLYRQLVVAELAAASGDVPGALTQLDAVRADGERGWVSSAYEARLLRARIQRATDPSAARAEATTLARDAQKHGFLRVARLARAIAKD